MKQKGCRVRWGTGRLSNPKNPIVARDHRKALGSRRNDSPHDSAIELETIRLVQQLEVFPSAADRVVASNLLKRSGRGIMMIRTFMDEVMFSEQGNEITMIHRHQLPIEDELTAADDQDREPCTLVACTDVERDYDREAVASSG